MSDQQAFASAFRQHIELRKHLMADIENAETDRAREAMARFAFRELRHSFEALAVLARKAGDIDAALRIEGVRSGFSGDFHIHFQEGNA